jgi:hypothetical protein
LRISDCFSNLTTRQPDNHDNPFEFRIADCGLIFKPDNPTTRQQ